MPDPPDVTAYHIEGIERVRGWPVSAAPAVGWTGQTLAAAELAAAELVALGWHRLELVWFVAGCRQTFTF